MIRRAGFEDIPLLCELLSELSGHETAEMEVKDRLRMVEKSAGEELYVFEQGRSIQGLLGFRIRVNIEEPSRYGEISLIVIHPGSRHLGIGRMLMEFAEQRARELGCQGHLACQRLWEGGGCTPVL